MSAAVSPRVAGARGRKFPPAPCMSPTAATRLTAGAAHGGMVAASANAGAGPGSGDRARSTITAISARVMGLPGRKYPSG